MVRVGGAVGSSFSPSSTSSPLGLGSGSAPFSLSTVKVSVQTTVDEPGVAAGLTAFWGVRMRALPPWSKPKKRNWSLMVLPRLFMVLVRAAGVPGARVMDSLGFLLLAL